MRILIFSPFYPPHIGGLESHADEFNRHINASGSRITVFTPQLPENAPMREQKYSNTVVIRFPAFELLPNYPIPQFWKPLFWKQWKEIQQTPFNITLSRTRFFFTSLMAWRFVRKQKIVWIHIEHGSDYATFNSSIKTLLGKAYDHLFGRFILRHSDKNIANSEASAAFVRKLSGRDQCEVIYRGIETSAIENTPRNENIQIQFGNIPKIVFIGRLIDGKGVRNLIEALALLGKKRYHCFIVGDGPDRKQLEKLVQKKSLSEQISFLGHRPFSEAIGILRASNIFVNPSYTEGIPTAIIEAALCQKAIIATDVGGTPEIITGKSDGFLVPAGDIETLRKKLEYLFEHPDICEKFGKHAFLAVKNRFNWESSIKKYLEIFQEILKRN